MCCDDDIPGQQVFQALIHITPIRRVNDLDLCHKTTHPVLLALPRKFFQPGMLFDFGSQTLNNGRGGGLKAPPVALGTQGVNAVTINTTVTFEPDESGISVEIPGCVAVAPEMFPAAVRARGRSRPRVIFTQ